MIFKDRQGQNLNRKKIKIISQTPTEIVADIERADTVTEEGTPINASVFNTFQQDINTALITANNAQLNADSALTTSNSALTVANNAQSAADSVTASFNELKNTSEFLNLNYSGDTATWAHNSINTLPTMFGIKADQTSNVKFFGDGNVKTNVVIDGDFYGSNGQNKVVYASELLDLIYPIGSIYMSVKNDHPCDLFGGYWLELMDKFLLGSGAIYSLNDTGGEANHTLTIEEMPDHNHIQTAQKTGESGYSWQRLSGHGSGDGISSYKGYWDADLGIALETTSTGGSLPHNNMPPYRVVNMWKRVTKEEFDNENIQ